MATDKTKAVSNAFRVTLCNSWEWKIIYAWTFAYKQKYFIGK